MIKRYLESQGQGYAPTTLAITCQWLEHLQSFLGATGLLEVLPGRLTEWNQELVWRPGPRGKNYSQSTVNQAVGAVRRFFRWAAEEGLVTRDPATHLKTRRVHNPRPELSPAESRKLLDATDSTSLTGTRNRALLGVLMETPISRATCSRIDLSHLQMDTGALLTNGRRRKLHSLSTGLLMDLQAYLDFARPLLVQRDEKALFVSQKGDRLKAPAIRQVVLKCTRVAGVRKP